jgi:hypothetical protein
MSSPSSADANIPAVTSSTNASPPSREAVNVPNIKQTVATTTGEEKAPTPAAQQQPYSIYSKGDKWIIVIIASIAAIFRKVYYYIVAYYKKKYCEKCKYLLCLQLETVL